ncbi:MAG: hypothetical protein AAF566_02060 [Pseudomonadota bacterium]
MSERLIQNSRAYFLRLSASLALLLTCVFAVNALIDPLWHFAGNRFGGISYRFEERNMKLNAFLDAPGRYDCLVLGASRTTLLDEEQIEGNTCFNMAFSQGHVREFVLIAEYLKSLGFQPERVIVGIAEVSFQPRAYTEGEKLPHYVLDGSQPNTPWEDYLGSTILRFSIQTLLEGEKFRRGYERREDGTYRGVILPIASVYTPPKEQFVTPEHFEPLDSEMLGDFERLLGVFPEARYEAYVPHVSDWFQAKLDMVGSLEPYVALRYELAKLFDGAFWDFTVPSAVTANPNLTYDGEHFIAPINTKIAKCLNGIEHECGTDVSSLSLEEYREQILPPIRELISREGLSVFQKHEQLGLLKPQG